MLEVNYKPLDLSSKDDKFVQIYQTQVKFLRDMKKKWFTFVFPDSKVKIDEEGNRRTGNGSWFDLHEQYSTAKDGTFDVHYYKNIAYDKKTGVKILTPRKLNFSGYLSLSIDKDEDLIWYLIFVSRHMEPADWLTPTSEKYVPNLARTGRNTIYFKVENTVKSREKDFNLNVLVQKAMRAIYGEDGLSDEQVLYYARSYNIPLTEGVSSAALRQELGSRVLVLDKRGNYSKNSLDEFLAALPEQKEQDVADKIAAQALANDLISLGLVHHSPKGQRHVWMTETGLELTIFGKSQDPFEALVDHFTKNRETVQEYEEVVTRKKAETTQTT